MKFQVDFHENEFVFALSESQEVIEPSFGEVIEVETVTNPYEGPYTVTPNVSGFKMETEGKYMKRDVTVKPIERYDVQNSSGGNTIYIANGG